MEATFTLLYDSYTGITGLEPSRTRIYKVDAAPDVLRDPTIYPSDMPQEGDPYPALSGDPTTQGLIADRMDILRRIAPGSTLVAWFYRRVSWAGQDVNLTDATGAQTFEVVGTSTFIETITIPLVHVRPLPGFVEYLPRIVTKPRATMRYTRTFSYVGQSRPISNTIQGETGKIHTDLGLPPIPPIVPEVAWLFQGGEVQEIGVDPVGGPSSPDRLLRLSYTWLVQQEVPARPETVQSFPEGDLKILAVPKIRPHRTIDVFRRSVPFASGSIEEVPVYVTNEEIAESVSTDLPGLGP